MRKSNRTTTYSKFLYHLLFAALVIVQLVFAADESNASIKEIKEFELSNKMKGVLIENHRVPAVSHSVWYNAGAADDFYGKSGVAHFLEHMMFLGTKNIPSGEFSKIIARSGGRDNAFTSHDYTAYFQNISKDKLEMVMQMESERMTGLILSEKDFENEKKVILEERRRVVDSNPSAISNEEIDANLYRNHPFGRPIIGWSEEIKKITLDDLKKFYERFYCPNNATLIISGAVELDEVKKLAEKYYGSIKPCTDRNQIRASRPIEPYARHLNMLIVKHPLAKQRTLTRKYLVRLDEGKEGLIARDPEVLALMFAAQLIGGSDTSILYRKMVLENKLANSVSAYFSPFSRDVGELTIFVAPKVGVGFTKIRTELDKELKEILQSPINKEDLKRVQNAIIANEVFSREGLFNIVRITGIQYTSGADIEFIKDWEKNVKSVKPETIKAAMNKFLKEENSTTGFLIPTDDVNKEDTE